MSVHPLVVKTAPERIWLQVSEDADSRDEPFPPIPNEDLTWCHESVLDCEVEYIRADLAIEAEPAQREVEQTALQRFNKFMGGDSETPIERVRFFCSLAMNGQDWLDVEPFFDALQPAQEPVAKLSDDDLRQWSDRHDIEGSIDWLRCIADDVLSLYAAPIPCPKCGEKEKEITQDINKCPGCGGEADNGHDRCYPPNPYYCSKCQNVEEIQATIAQQAEEIAAHVRITNADNKKILEQAERIKELNKYRSELAQEAYYANHYRVANDNLVEQLSAANERIKDMEAKYATVLTDWNTLETEVQEMVVETAKQASLIERALECLKHPWEIERAPVIAAIERHQKGKVE